MKKTIRILGVAAFLMTILALTAFAGTWRSDSRGWWWDEGNGTYPAGCWAWCDGNYDGTAECYYFDNNGYCLMNTRTPDGYYVNSSGAWVENGVVQTQYVGVQTPAYNVPEVPVSQGVAQGYNLAGYQSLVTSDEGTDFGYLNLEANGTGVIQIGYDSPQYQLTWTRSEDTIRLKYGFDTHTAYYYEDLGQIRLPLGDYVYYFEVV